MSGAAAAVTSLDDEGARAILLVGLLLFFPVAAYHRVRSTTGERLDRRQEGLFVLLTLRPLGVACMLGVLAFAVDPRWMAWSSVPLPTGLRWSGAGLGVVAGGLLTWTLRTLGRNLTDTVVTRRDHALVTSGPYRWVRHPFYVSTALAILANAFLTANAFVLATGAAALALLVLRTRKEEEILLARFGEPYRRYVERTGRFLPRSLVPSGRRTSPGGSSGNRSGY